MAPSRALGHRPFRATQAGSSQRQMMVRKSGAGGRKACFVPSGNAELAGNWRPRERALSHGFRGPASTARCARAPAVVHKVSPVLPKTVRWGSLNHNARTPMAKMMKLRVGVADDPTQLQPSLSDCLATMLRQAEPLITAVAVAPANEQDGAQAARLIDTQPAERCPPRVLGG